MKKKQQEIKTEQKLKRDNLSQAKKEEEKLLSADVIEKRTDKEIEINFKYFSPEYKEYQEAYEKLMEKIYKNEENLRSKIKTSVKRKTKNKEDPNRKSSFNYFC